MRLILSELAIKPHDKLDMLLNRIKHRHSLLILLLMCIALIQSCTTRPSREQPQNQKITWADRQQQLSQITHWTTQGAMSVRSPDTSGSASINWEQKPNEYQIRIFGPLGSGQLQINGNPEQVILITANQEEFSAPSAETLLKQYTGWYLPVSNLYYWIRGLPAPGSINKMTFDTYQHLQTLQQDGWTINFLRYTAAQGIDLPSRIDLTNEQLRVRIVVSQWQI